MSPFFVLMARPPKLFWSLPQCVAFLRRHNIKTETEYAHFRVSASLSAEVKAELNNMPASLDTYYGVTWPDLTGHGKKRRREAQLSYLAFADAVKLIASFNVRFASRGEYRAWLVEQPLDIRRRLPTDPKRYYSQFNVFDADTYYQRTLLNVPAYMTFSEAVAVMRRENINSSRRYKAAMADTTLRGFNVSAAFVHDRQRLPIDYQHYVQNDYELYQAFFGRAPYLSAHSEMGRRQDCSA